MQQAIPSDKRVSVAGTLNQLPSSIAAGGGTTKLDLNYLYDTALGMLKDHHSDGDDVRLLDSAINGMLSRPAFKLHGRQKLPRHAGSDARRIWRSWHRGDAGGWAYQGRHANRRHAGLARGNLVRRHHHRHRWRECSGLEPQPGGRQDARRAGYLGDAQDFTRIQQGLAGYQAYPRRDPDQIGSRTSGRRRYRLHSNHPIQRTDV